MAGEITTTRYPYPGFTVFDCNALAGAEYRHPETRLRYGIGAFYYRGRMQSAVDAKTGQPADPAVLVDACGFIPADPADQRDFDVIYGPDGCGFLCLMQDASAALVCSHAAIDGDYTLPAGIGAVVATGTVTAGGQTYTRCLYVLPSDTEMTITSDGPADLLLIAAAP